MILAEIQAIYILDLQLHRRTGDAIETLREEASELSQGLAKP